jgi:hypothetical protein
MDAEQTRARRTAIGLVVVLLLSGLALGVAFDRVVLGARAPRPPWWQRQKPEAQVAKLTKELGLDAEQAMRVEAAMQQRWQGMTTVLGRVEPELEAIRSEANRSIASALRPEQQERFGRLVQEEAERRAAMRKDLKAAP